MVAENDQRDLKGDLDNLLFSVRRSVRYHSRRRMFFDGLGAVKNWLSVVFGSATIVAVLGDVGPGWIAGAASLVTVFAGLDLAIGSARAARLHADLGRRFIALEKDFILIESPAATDLMHFKARRLDIEAEEPPVHRVLDVLCHNELMRAMGYPSNQMARVRWYQRWLAHVLDVGLDDIRDPNCQPAT